MSTQVALIPALDTGDRLSPEEFQRRYALRPDIKKAELIHGVVFVSSPVRSPEHSQPHVILVEEFGIYRRASRGVLSDADGSLRLEAGDEVRPDVMLRYSPSRGGRSYVDEDHYVRGVPELVAEVAATSASYGLHDKLDLYRELGVPEYIVWRTEDGAIDWFALEDGAYVPIPAGEDGLTRSRVFPGLAMDLAALVEAANASIAASLEQPQ
jgi:Uma2 family endonuclease